MPEHPYRSHAPVPPPEGSRTWWRRVVRWLALAAQTFFGVLALMALVVLANALVNAVPVVVALALAVLALLTV